jgi:hypothetical protein
MSLTPPMMAGDLFPRFTPAHPDVSPPGAPSRRCPRSSRSRSRTWASERSR